MTLCYGVKVHKKRTKSHKIQAALDNSDFTVHIYFRVSHLT